MMRLVVPIVALVLGGLTPAFADPSPAVPPAAAEAASPPKTASQILDELFDRLAATEDPDESAGIVAAIERAWSRSGSDTADLLMSRAEQAMQSKDYPLALKLLDATVALDPGWAQAWNQRATVRFESGDERGSMADIAETLKRDPRHFGALAGMGEMLDDAGLKDQALRVYERALAIAPHYAPLRERFDQLKASAAGRSL